MIEQFGTSIEIKIEWENDDEIQVFSKLVTEEEVNGSNMPYIFSIHHLFTLMKEKNYNVKENGKKLELHTIIHAGGIEFKQITEIMMEEI